MARPAVAHSAMPDNPGTFIRNHLLPDIVLDEPGLDGAPGWPGGYALLMRLDEPTVFLRGKERQTLESGWYVYAGSACGPGGVGARLRRHFRRDKTLHWHVDQLTVRAARTEAFAIAGGKECDIVTSLSRTGRFDFPIVGFGSSDCAECPAHLLKWRK